MFQLSGCGNGNKSGIPRDDGNNSRRRGTGSLTSMGRTRRGSPGQQRGDTTDTRADGPTATMVDRRAPGETNDGKTTYADVGLKAMMEWRVTRGQTQERRGR